MRAVVASVEPLTLPCCCVIAAAAAAAATAAAAAAISASRQSTHFTPNRFKCNHNDVASNNDDDAHDDHDGLPSAVEHFAGIGRAGEDSAVMRVLVRVMLLLLMRVSQRNGQSRAPVAPLLRMAALLPPVLIRLDVEFSRQIFDGGSVVELGGEEGGGRRGGGGLLLLVAAGRRCSRSHAAALTPDFAASAPALATSTALFNPALVASAAADTPDLAASAPALATSTALLRPALVTSPIAVTPDLTASNAREKGLNDAGSSAAAAAAGACGATLPATPDFAFSRPDAAASPTLFRPDLVASTALDMPVASLTDDRPDSHSAKEFC